MTQGLRVHVDTCADQPEGAKPAWLVGVGRGGLQGAAGDVAAELGNLAHLGQGGRGDTAIGGTDATERRPDELR